MNAEITKIYTERLESVRNRARMLRDALADPSALSEIAIDGVSEKIPRAQLVQELKELEAEELSLMMKAAGRSSRIFKVDLR